MYKTKKKIYVSNLKGRNYRKHVVLLNPHIYFSGSIVRFPFVTFSFYIFSCKIRNANLSNYKDITAESKNLR